MRWAKVLSRMALLLLPEYLMVVLALGAVQAFVFPNPDFSSLGTGGASCLRRGWPLGGRCSRSPRPPRYP